MFEKKVYIERRRALKENLESGIILFLGNEDAPLNYGSNTYAFRQDSSFLYYFGLDSQSLAAIIDIDETNEIIFGDNRPLDDVVWMGPEKSISERASEVGVRNSLSRGELAGFLTGELKKGRKIHFLPQYRKTNMLYIENYIGIKADLVNHHASSALTRAVIMQRSKKSVEEILQIEEAIDISFEMNTLAMKMIKPGMYEREISGAVEGIALSRGKGVSFPIIFSVHGEILHNHHHENIMKEGEIAVLDSGAESLLHYASDITRTIPVSGKFSGLQKEVYNIVLESQMKAIEGIKPGKSFKEIHLLAARIIAGGLKELGIMTGDTNEAVKNGAHALFFPHGLGHMMGLDVHDMEGLGENMVGYDKNTRRSEQFGLAYLRFAKELEPGYVLTVEPGIYFIPQLIQMWKEENKHSEFINYNKLENFMEFGGIRIEDDVLVTEDGYKVLGKSIPKTVADVEDYCSR